MRSIDCTARVTHVIRALLGTALLLALPLRVAAQEQVEYYGTDALGSIRIVFNADGSVKGRTDFGPYVEELTPALGQAVYAQLFRDGESGQDYAQARMYQPRTGRFNAPDPVYDGFFDPQRWNRYTYAAANPLTLTDPSGLNAPAFHSGVVGCDLVEFRAWCDFMLQMDLAWYFGGGGSFGGLLGGGADFGGGGGQPQNPVPPPAPPLFQPPELPQPPGPPPDSPEIKCEPVPFKVTGVGPGQATGATAIT